MTHPSRLSYRWVILACCVLAYATSYLIRWSYTGLAEYISGDLELDKADLGLLGAAFFYPYALAQVPWGRLTDRRGGRPVIAGGVMAAGLCLGLFASAQTLAGAMGWRLAVGLLTASVFVPVAGLLARWFDTRERGLANGVYYGLGGGLGEAGAFLLLPVLEIYVIQQSGFPVAGWRGSLVLIAGLVVLIGLLCLLLLRSMPAWADERVSAAPRNPPGLAPQGWQQEPTGQRLLTDPLLWLLGGYWAAAVVGLRLVPGWLTLYATDLYRVESGLDQDAAILAGGSLGLLYVLGHVLGSPVAGGLSDRIIRYPLSRIGVASAGLALSAGALSILAVTIPTPWMFGIIALLLGITLHLSPLINAAVAERWGVRRAGESLGWINMTGQIAGALSLSVSGYLGLAMAGDSGNPIHEYAGIWWLGAVVCAIGAIMGWWGHRRLVRDGVVTRVGVCLAE